jgi:hypothetical protein
VVKWIVIVGLAVQILGFGLFTATLLIWRNAKEEVPHRCGTGRRVNEVAKDLDHALHSGTIDHGRMCLQACRGESFSYQP